MTKTIKLSRALQRMNNAWRLSKKSTTLCAVLASVLAMSTGPGRAGETLSESITASKSDLLTDQGRRATEVRAEAVAQRLCRKFRNTSTVAQKETYAACLHDAMASARGQMDSAVAAESRKAQTSAPVASAAPSPQAEERVAGN